MNTCDIIEEGDRGREGEMMCEINECNCRLQCLVDYVGNFKFWIIHTSGGACVSDLDSCFWFALESYSIFF